MWRITICLLCPLLLGTVVSVETTGQESSGMTPVPIQSGVSQLSPQNTMIQFIGTHVGDNPDPRTGHFQKFNGEAMVDASDNRVVSLKVEIETDSLWTPIPNLTNHLKSPDFFDTREHPTARFEATEINGGSEEGDYTVTGNLTLLGNTNEISFPAIVAVNDAGVTMSAALVIDRTQFGMELMQDRVMKEVKLNLAIGKSAAGGGGQARENFDPAAFFKRRDANGDGKLIGDEIPERMQEVVDRFDTDGDGAISQTEFVERMRQFRNRPAPERQRTRSRPGRPE